MGASNAPWALGRKTIHKIAVHALFPLQNDIWHVESKHHLQPVKGLLVNFPLIRFFLWNNFPSLSTLYCHIP